MPPVEMHFEHPKNPNATDYLEAGKTANLKYVTPVELIVECDAQDTKGKLTLKGDPNLLDFFATYPDPQGKLHTEQFLYNGPIEFWGQYKIRIVSRLFDPSMSFNHVIQPKVTPSVNVKHPELVKV